MLKKFIFSVATPIACALSIVGTSVQAGPCCPPPCCDTPTCCLPEWFTDALIFVGAASIGAIAGVATGYAIRESGHDGHHGYDGLPGPQGVQGHQGHEGDQGPQGVYGAQGVQGPQGAFGALGPTGPAGPTGAKGPTGTTGTTGPTGATGTAGAGFSTLPASFTAIAFGATISAAPTAGTVSLFAISPNGVPFGPNLFSGLAGSVTVNPPFYQGSYVVGVELSVGYTNSGAQTVTIIPSVTGGVNLPGPATITIPSTPTPTTSILIFTVDLPIQV